MCTNCIYYHKNGGRCLGQCSTCSDHWNTPVESGTLCEIHIAHECHKYIKKEGK